MSYRICIHVIYLYIDRFLSRRAAQLHLYQQYMMVHVLANVPRKNEARIYEQVVYLEGDLGGQE